MNKKELPISGIASFGKYPICTNLNNINGDVAILGVPSDLGVGFLSGTRLGPRRIREASTQYGRGYDGFYDPERNDTFLSSPWKIIDCGDSDIVQGDLIKTLNLIEEKVRKIIKSNTMPVVLGGDHSISIPVAKALDSYDNLTVIQFDAHLDWTDSRDGQKLGNGSPMRRMSEMDHIGDMVQIGLRGLGSSSKKDFKDAREYGSKLISAREANSLPVEKILQQIPEFENAYVTIDIDAFDISIAPGTGSPSPGGFSFEKLNLLLEGIAQKGNIAAFDLVEVAPQYDPTNTTTRIAALTILNFIAFILKSKE